MLTREEIAEIVQYCKEKGVSYKSVGTRVHTDEHRDAHADRGGIADPGQPGRGDDTGNNPGVVEPCLA